MRGLGIALLCASLAGLASAQAFKDLPPARTQKVSSTPIATVSVRAGSSATVHLPFQVAQGFHINSHKPGSELLIPTVLRLSPPTNISVGMVEYPEGKELSFDFAPDEKLNVYAGEFQVGAMVRPARVVTPGRYRVHGSLRYQACDNRACYPPMQVPIAFDVKVLKPVSNRSPRRNPPASPHIHQ